MDFKKVTISEEDNELSHFARAIAIPVRISILRIIIMNGEWVTPDVFADLDLGPVTKERHLKAMTYLGLIKEKHYNRKVYYNINEDVFIKMSEEFIELFEYYKKSRNN